MSAYRPRLSAGVSFWVMIVAYLGLMFAASAPSPLYVVYQARWHFSAITLTSIFGVYALALLLTLLTVGGLSDFIGRKPVLLAGFTALVASMVVFAHADGVGWLYLGRVLQGLAAGSSLGALSAGLIDFAGPNQNRKVASITPDVREQPQFVTSLTGTLQLGPNGYYLADSRGRETSLVLEAPNTQIDFGALLGKAIVLRGTLTKHDSSYLMAANQVSLAP